MFYESICQVYDYIFPTNINQLSFINNSSPILEFDSILEIGSATGNLTELLFSKTKKVSGIDLNSDLISLAAKKNTQISYKNINMLDIDNYWVNNFDKIICFGNTLVHLNNFDEINIFFKKVFNCLKKDGYFFVQIIDYDKIFTKNTLKLPLIDNDKVKFIRTYEIVSESKIIFNSKLIIKESNQIIKNSICLTPIRKQLINSFLADIGFKDIEFFENFNGDSTDENSIQLVFKCKK
ncbi:MAG: class I SAM-dependent methyltransferase [Fusobacteriaceae bacterium]|nr:class I SAM-dependent methyltransferase [Fusobacteriaceae bacterium]